MTKRSHLIAPFSLFLLAHLLLMADAGRNDNGGNKRVKDLIPQEDISKNLEELRKDMEKSQKEVQKTLREDFDKSQKDLQRRFQSELEKTRGRLGDDLKRLRDDLRGDLEKSQKSLRRGIAEDLGKAQKEVREDLLNREKRILEEFSQSRESLRKSIQEAFERKHSEIRNELSEARRAILADLLRTKVDLHNALKEDLERKHKAIENDIAATRDHVRNALREELARKHSSLEENLRLTRSEVKQAIQEDISRIQAAVKEKQDGVLAGLREDFTRAKGKLEARDNDWAQLRSELKHDVKDALATYHRDHDSRSISERVAEKVAHIKDRTRQVPAAVKEAVHEAAESHRSRPVSEAVINDLRQSDPEHWDWGGLIPQQPGASSTYSADWGKMALGAVVWRQEWGRLLRDEVASLRFPPLKLPEEQGGHVIWMWLKKSGSDLLVRTRYHYPFGPKEVSMPLRGRVTLDFPSQPTAIHLEQEASTMLTRDWSTFSTFGSVPWNLLNADAPPKAQFTLQA